VKMTSQQSPSRERIAEERQKLNGDVRPALLGGWAGEGAGLGEYQSTRPLTPAIYDLTSFSDGYGDLAPRPLLAYSVPALRFPECFHPGQALRARSSARFAVCSKLALGTSPPLHGVSNWSVVSPHDLQRRQPTTHRTEQVHVRPEYRESLKHQ
jgi:hypothetical protein